MTQWTQRTPVIQWMRPPTAPAGSTAKKNASSKEDAVDWTHARTGALIRSSAIASRTGSSQNPGGMSLLSNALSRLHSTL